MQNIASMSIFKEERQEKIFGLRESQGVREWGRGNQKSFGCFSKTVTPLSPFIFF